MLQRTFRPAILIEERNVCFASRQTTSRWDPRFQGGHWSELSNNSPFSRCFSSGNYRGGLFTMGDTNVIFGGIGKIWAGFRVRR